MAPIAPISAYLDAVCAIRAGGQAGELSYRTPMENLLGALLPPDVGITHEGKKIAGAGIPDFVIRATLHGAARIIGCIETKTPGDADLRGARAHQAQFGRYKNAFPNCVFTDYLRFVFYQNGELVDDIAIAEFSPQGDIRPLADNHNRFIALLESAFVGQEFRIDSADQLVASMATLAREMANAIAVAMQNPRTHAGANLVGHMHAFNNYLLDDITPAQFADLVAQTTAYGLLIARVQCPPNTPFTRQQAAGLIPPNIHLLRVFFEMITGVRIADEIRWIVDRLADIFAVADVHAIMRRHGQQTGAQDPVFHFYESFLSKYNPGERFKRGVWYTPQPVVNFIVRAVHEVLQNQLGIQNGLANTDSVTVPVAAKDTDAAKADDADDADAAPSETKTETYHQLQILDPGAGTGAFSAEIIRQIHAMVDQGEWSDYVEQHLLPRVSGFEILMAPYAMAHLRLALLLKDLGYAPRQNPPPRIQVFLSNALHLQDTDRAAPLMADWISAEARAAERIKTQAPVICVLGNPPYLAASANKGKWITGLIEDYKYTDGVHFKERKHWLGDDYVKFIRYGQHFMEKGGRGIVAFVNPHGFLDNRTFRGMRWQLLRAYDRIYVIDMHGNTRRREVAPDGGRDDNVFNIMQGVSINLFVKTGEKPDGALARVFHYDLFGARQHKYDFLRGHTLATVPFTELRPQAPMYYMVPRDYRLRAQYDKGFAINEIFPLHNSGIITSRDNFCIHFTRDSAAQTIDEFLSLPNEAAREKFALGKDGRDWTVANARQDLQTHYPNGGALCQIAYRPFDDRWTFYTGNSKGFQVSARGDVMRHFMLGDNLGLVTFRQFNARNIANPQFIVDKIMEGHLMADINYVFPLYLYTAPDQLGAPAAARAPNLNMEIVGKIADHLGLAFSEKSGRNALTPENLLDYIYAVLHSPAYRAKFAEFLKTDFPRIPIPANAQEFRRLGKIGEQLRQTHLLRHPAGQKGAVAFPVSGDNRVTAPRHEKDRVYINREQYFARVSAAVWTHRIGGYLPAQKFLKDRKNRALTYDDIQRYKHLIAALARTQTLVGTLDA